MRSVLPLLLSLLALACSSQSVHAQGGKAVQTIVKVLTGVGAAESMRRSGQSYEEYKHEDAILTQLRNQGVDANKSSVFSVYFSTSGGVWADFWSHPDLFFVVDIEGQGTKLVPQIRYNYRGEPVLDVVVADIVPPGSRVVVRVLDDDTSSDVMWNSILQTRANLSVTPEVSATQFVSVTANASGQFAILDRNVRIDAPDFIASAVFTVPETEDGRWVAEAQLIDGSQRNVGTLKFASLWSAIKQQEQKVGKSYGKFIFWGVIGLCLLFWFGWSVISDSEDDSAAAPLKET